jgi:hypothetical protein
METKYFESHITIDPVKDDVGVRLLQSLAAEFHFRVSELYVIKDDSPNVRDSFLTGRNASYDQLKIDMDDLIKELSKLDFRPRRAKIEAIIYDQRY